MHCLYSEGWGGRGIWRGIILLVVLSLCGCSTVQPRRTLALGSGGPDSWVQEPIQPEGAPLWTESGSSVELLGLEHLRVRSPEQEEAARRAEVERALSHVKAVASGVERVGTRLVLTYWAEGGALTLVDYRAQSGQGGRAGRVEEREKLGREVTLALTGYGGGTRGLVELALVREHAGWELESVSRREVARPAEARSLAVRLPGVSSESYVRAHEVASRLLRPLQVPEEGEVEQDVEVRLEDGRVVEVMPRRYEVRSGMRGRQRQLAPALVGEVTWLLLGFAEGLGPRTLRLKMRATHGRGEAQARGWVETVQVQRAELGSGEDEDFAAAYRQLHEQTLRLWREEVEEGARWVVRSGVEELSLWYAGGLLGRGLGVLAELTLPVVRTVLGKGGPATARWLRSAILRLPPDAKRDFERLWAKVQLEGEAALTHGERDALRAAMLKLERLVQEPLDKAAKEKLREAARRYYAKLHPELDALLRQGAAYPIHHRRPLEHAHLFPDDDINDPRNLVLVFEEVHKRINKLWGRFRKARPNATADDVRLAAREIDDLFKPWYDRAVNPSERHLLASQLPGAEGKALERLRQLFPGLE